MKKNIVLIPTRLESRRLPRKALLEIDLVKEAKGTFGYYDIFTKIQGESSSEIEDIITKKIRNIENVTATTTLSIIPEQDFEK